MCIPWSRYYLCAALMAGAGLVYSSGVTLTPARETLRAMQSPSRQSLSLSLSLSLSFSLSLCVRCRAAAGNRANVRNEAKGLIVVAILNQFRPFQSSVCPRSLVSCFYSSIASIAPPAPRGPGRRPTQSHLDGTAAKTLLADQMTGDRKAAVKPPQQPSWRT